MKKYAKALTIILSCFILICGCSQKTVQKNNTTEETKRRIITVGFWKSEQLLTGDRLQQFIEKKFNILIVPVNLSEIRWDDDLQKMAVRGELPDLFVDDIIGTKRYYDWKEHGIVQKITGTLSNYPNLAAYMEDPYLEPMKDERGMLYCIPRKGYNDSFQWGLMRCVLLRKDIVNSLGRTMPENYSEFKELLQLFADTGKGEGKTLVPLTTENINKLEALYLGAYPNLCNLERGWIWEGGRYIPAYYSVDMERGLSMMRELYTEGLLDPQFPYTSAGEAERKFLNGESIALCIPYFRLLQDYKSIDEDFKFDEAVEVMRPWKQPDGSVYRFTTTQHWSELYIAHHVDAQKRDKILSLLNYLLSEEFCLDLKEQELSEEPSIAFFSDLVTLGITFSYKNPEMYADESMQNIFDYISKESRWYGECTRTAEYRLDIPISYGLRKELLPDNQKIHDELIKVILSEEDVHTAWEKVRSSLRDEYNIEEAIKKVNSFTDEK